MATGRMSRPLLQLRDVTVYRGDRLVLDRFSLELACGTQTAIVGPNGSGKSTLLKLISGDVHIVPRDDSWFRLMGLDRWSVWDVRATLGVVSHDLHREYDGDVTGLDVILSGFYSSIGTYSHQTFTSGQGDRAREVAAQVEIADLVHRPYGSLSTGEQRRCLLGRALVHRPTALILDEPTAGLDLRATSFYLDVLRQVMAGGTTVVLVTHHVHEIPPEVSRLIFMNRGRVIADGPRAALLTGAQLSRLFELPIELVTVGDYVYATRGTIEGKADRVDDGCSERGPREPIQG